MPILKHYKQTGYVQIPNILAQSSSLSYEALGVLVNLLSRPEDWVVRKTYFITKKCGKGTLTRIFKELQEFGYLKMTYPRNEKGQIENIWLVSDEQIENVSKEDVKPANTTEKPENGKPDVRLTRRSDNETLQINNNTNKEFTKKENISSSVDERSNGFEEFWNKYPRKQGRKPAYKKWITMKCYKILSEILDDLETRAKNCYPNGWLDQKTGLIVDMQYIPLPATYLNQERWEDEFCEVL